MFNQLNDHIKYRIYQYDPTYKNKFNIVLEELKLFILFKFKTKYNLTEPKKWSERIHKIEPNQNDTVIHFSKECLRLLKETITDGTTTEFLKALLRRREATV